MDRANYYSAQDQYSISNLAEPRSQSVSLDQVEIDSAWWSIPWETFSISHSLDSILTATVFQGLVRATDKSQCEKRYPSQHKLTAKHMTSQVWMKVWSVGDTSQEGLRFYCCSRSRQERSPAKSNNSQKRAPTAYSTFQYRPSGFYELLQCIIVIEFLIENSSLSLSFLEARALSLLRQ